MLWLVIGDESHQIISCNVHEEDGVYQLWISRPNGKNKKIDESKDKNEMILIKEAIDYAISKQDPILKLR